MNAKMLSSLMGLAFLLTAASVLAGDEQEETCTVSYENLRGEVTWGTVECDSPYAGKCLKEARTGKGEETFWQEVECK